ncbi:MAG: DNA-binding protein [Sulfurimonas sp.]|uniref:DNA-binding protein n=1 Tax=Sulfurimonas sp. TaxID=2022749 RepID=UPI002612675E|nr:DNA-binding protein [Sulfurimonas sp.]MDD2653372.1 DNA-binding protein [Sulfurimonas sp.]MDD3450678.1 DNA-binding protein [Sulfurimonas sp.]
MKIDDETHIKLMINEINNLDPKYKKLIALNQKQTANAIGVSSSTMESWRREAVGPEYKKMDLGKKGRVLYSKIAVAAWMVNGSGTIKTA